MEVKGWKRREGLFGYSFALYNIRIPIKASIVHLFPFLIPKVLCLVWFGFVVRTKHKI